jgi:hypothetical protein
LNVDDFERTIDPNTGLEVLRLKKGAAARKGLTDLLDVEFEMITGVDGKQTIVVKGGENQGNSGKLFAFYSDVKYVIIGDAKFELMTDASGRTTIKIKKERPPTRTRLFKKLISKSFLFSLAELEVIEKPIDINDFEEIIDLKTGLKILKLKSDVAKRAGMMELLDTQFETYIDTKTGKQSIRIKQTDDNKLDRIYSLKTKRFKSLFFNLIDVKFEIITDASGKQLLRMIQEIPTTRKIIFLLMIFYFVLYIQSK